MFKQSQRGMTFIGLMLVLAVAAFIGTLLMVMLPMFSEYYSVKSAAKSLSQEPGVATMDTGHIKDLLFKRLNISFSESVKREDVKLDKIDQGWHMKVEYEVRHNWLKNFDIVGHFLVDQDLKAGGAPSGE
jgi:hypothetical protein